MKRLILLLLFFKGCVAFGQSVTTPLDSVMRIMDSLKVSTMAISKTINGTPTMYGDLYVRKTTFGVPESDSIIEQQEDTILAVLIVCDTMKYTNYTPMLNKENYFDKSGSLVWVIGYEVREKKVDYDVVFPNMNHLTYFIHKEYLDENKKPLSKSIIVWQSK